MFGFRKRTPSPQSDPRVIVVMATPLHNRRHMRTTFQMPVQLNLAGQLNDVQLVDISLKGALVDTGVRQTCRIGTHGRLRIRLSATNQIAMDVVVARITGNQIGLECRQIDLDSVTNLRHLLAHNRMDLGLLQRELSQLCYQP